MAGYIGNAPVPQATQTRDTFTATEGQTSFPTSGYTPNYLDVYLNGVKLPPEDFTATNGSDVVLDTGAAVNDVLEVVAFSTFEVQGDINADSVTTGTFTSNGIDDNATSTAMTLDSSGNLLVGKTSVLNAVITDGGSLHEDGRATFTRTDDVPLWASRQGTDGAIVNLYKGAVNVGSIGNKSTNIYIGSGDAGLQFRAGGDDITPFNTLTNSATNGITDLGDSGSRFKDLYLSGGVYLGGTGAANYLEDYEEGTFTPTSPHGGFTATSGYYVKIGNMVTVFMNMTCNTNSNIFTIQGLPFAATGDISVYDWGRDSIPVVFADEGTTNPAGGNFTGIPTELTVKEFVNNNNLTYGHFNGGSGRVALKGSYFTI